MGSSHISGFANVRFNVVKFEFMMSFHPFPPTITHALFKAQFEMSFQDQFDVVLVNEKLETSLAEAQRLYDNFKKS